MRRTDHGAAGRASTGPGPRPGVGRQAMVAWAVRRGHDISALCVFERARASSGTCECKLWSCRDEHERCRSPLRACRDERDATGGVSSVDEAGSLPLSLSPSLTLCSHYQTVKTVNQILAAFPVTPCSHYLQSLHSSSITSFLSPLPLSLSLSVCVCACVCVCLSNARKCWNHSLVSFVLANRFTHWRLHFRS